MAIPASFREDLLDTPSANETVLFANSPSFLLNRLRKDNSVAYVADTLKTEEIIDALAAYSALPKDPTDIVKAYIFLLALSLKENLPSFRDQLLAIELSRLQWGDQIRQQILREAIPTIRTGYRFTNLNKTEATKVVYQVHESPVSDAHSTQQLLRAPRK